MEKCIFKKAQMRTYNTSHFFVTFYLIRALIFLFKIQDGERAARVFVRTRVVLLSNIFMIDEFWCKRVCLTDNTECDHLTSFSFANIQNGGVHTYLSCPQCSIFPSLKIFIKSRLSSSFCMPQRARVLESFNDDASMFQIWIFKK